MKRITFFKSLLVAAGLMTGASAWADVEITETYDFYSFATGDGYITLSSTEYTNDDETVYLANDLTMSDVTMDLSKRFAFDLVSARNSDGWRFRNTGTTYQKGLIVQYKSGTGNPWRMSIVDLKANDKVKITYSVKATTANLKFANTNAKLSDAVVAKDGVMTSGQEYTIVNDGQLDLYVSNNNIGIHSVIIKTTGTETVTAPTFALTGAYNETRKVTITAGASDAGNAVTTYYTTDGSTPTSSSPNSFTGASQEVTVGEGAASETTVTVKAICVSTSTASSEIATSDAITVGTKIKLAQPNITLTGMGLSGENYYKQYSFTANNTGTYGNPTITVSATLGGDAISSPYTASAAGTISVVASADGYDDSDAATLDVDGNPYKLVRSYDFTQNSYRDGLSTEGSNITINGAGVSVYRVTTANHIEGLTLSTVSGPTTNFGFTIAVNSDTRKGLAPRWGSGTITINNWISGSFALLYDLVGDGVYATSSNGTFSFGGQINWNTFTTLEVYVPAGAVVPVTANAYGYQTFASDYPLDFTSTATKAYIATSEGAGKVMMTKVTKVPAGTGMLLQCAANENIPVLTTDADDVSSNMFVRGTGAAVEAGTTTNRYVLGAEGETVAFYQIDEDPATVSTSQAYLEVAATSARLSIAFDDETTGIENLTPTLSQGEGAIYDLQGRRVAQPTKGLYIVNGKKVVIK